MSQVTFDLPTASLLALKVQPAQAADEIRMAAAVKWYEMGRISSGAAAQLAGVPRTRLCAPGAAGRLRRRYVSFD